jgi:hypothetical protein
MAGSLRQGSSSGRAQGLTTHGLPAIAREANVPFSRALAARGKRTKRIQDSESPPSPVGLWRAAFVKAPRLAAPRVLRPMACQRSPVRPTCRSAGRSPLVADEQNVSRTRRARRRPLGYGGQPSSRLLVWPRPGSYDPWLASRSLGEGWWRRRELNPRPRKPNLKSLRV